MSRYSIEPATLADVPLLNQLIAASVRKLNTPEYSSQQIESALTYVYGIDSQLVEDGTYYVAVADGRLVGCGGWSKRKTLFGGDQAKIVPDDEIFLNPLTDAAKIRAFFVHPQFARQGIGRALMRAAETAAYQAGFYKLELMATLTGKPLYAASGFEVIERIDYPMPDGIVFPVERMMKLIEPLAVETAVLA